MRIVALTLLAATPLLVSGCGSTGEPIPEGARLYADLGCAGCHGEGLAGKRTAPPLTGLAGHWDQASLEHFIRDPRGYEPVPYHLQELRQQTPLRMPPLVKADDTELATLVSYLLEQ